MEKSTSVTSADEVDRYVVMLALVNVATGTISTLAWQRRDGTACACRLSIHVASAGRCRGACCR